MNTVLMTDEEAVLFMAFREHQDNFSILLASGIFSIKSGKARINFNMEGMIESVDVDVPTFRRGHKQINSPESFRLD